MLRPGSQKVANPTRIVVDTQPNPMTIDSVRYSEENCHVGATGTEHPQGGTSIPKPVPFGLDREELLCADRSDVHDAA